MIVTTVVIVLSAILYVLFVDHMRYLRQKQLVEQYVRRKNEFRQWFCKEGVTV